MLQGEKVLLRAVERGDLPRLWAFNNSLTVELAGGGDPPWPQAFDRLVAEYEKGWSTGGRDGPAFAIEADARLIGVCGLRVAEGANRTAELGITIGDTAYWGRGYGRDAVATLVAYGFDQLNLRRVWLQTHARNQRGIRAYLACGFVEEGRLREHVWSDGGYDDLVCMGVLRSDWQAARGVGSQEA